MVKALLVGLPQVDNVLRTIRSDWDFLPPVPDISSLFKGLNEETIDNDIQVLFVLDQFFDVDGGDTTFEKLVVMMAPYCVLGIVNYRPDLQSLMNERIGLEAYNSGEDSANLPYYFINVKRTGESIDIALNNYVTNPAADDDTVAALTGRTPDETVQDRMAARMAAEDDEFDANLKPIENNPYLGQVVAVTSSKGGSGKSTVTLSLATFLAHSSINSVREGLEKKPLKIVVLDCDVRDGQLGFLTGFAKPTVINLRLKGVSKQNINETVIHSDRLKLDLILAPKRARSSEDTPPEFHAELIHELRGMYDYVFLDTSVNYLDPLLEKVAYPAADQIIFVTDIVVNSVFSMARWIREVTTAKEKGGMGIKRRKIGIVVNKVLSDVNMPGDKIAAAASGLPILTAIPSAPKFIAHAANNHSMEVVLKHAGIYKSVRYLASLVVAGKYKLSKNVDA